ncbi:hypothetical protein DFJ73DRAFT_767763 [Zopfochytrium polystomum]|nr:hypothetical protein DFJ73DRAFT_767763 [Zopfochytrium polystomum]
MDAAVSFTKEVPNAPAIPGEGKVLVSVKAPCFAGAAGARRGDGSLVMVVGCPRVSAFLPDGKVVALPEGVSTVYDNFLQGVRIGGDKPFLGTRSIINGAAGPYVWQTYNEIHKRIRDVGCGMAKKGLSPNSHVGLFSINRAEWVIAEQGCFMFSHVTVPLYDTLGADAIEFISNQTKLPLIFATSDKAKTIIKLKPKLPHTRILVIMDTPDAETIAAGKAAGLDVLTFLDLEQLGRQNPCDPVPPTTETLGTICYTSGTTGQPKGVMLSHGNMIAFCAAMNEAARLGRFAGINKDDVYMSYLPLAHVFERACQIVVVNHGGAIGFYQGDTLKLLDDVAELKPTLFPSVPRVYNRIFDKVWALTKSKSAMEQYLFNTAYQAKKFHLQSGHLTHWLWDRLVFAKVRQRLGGRCRMLLTGAAPISAEVIEFLRICFSCQVYEGYGQTETCAGLSVSDMHDLSSGHVGVPLTCVQVKLVDVPAMNYTSKDTPNPRGEICVKGAPVFKGYYQSPEKTAEVLDADGWAHTGDIGMWDDKGRLTIIDRVKNIFKLSQGEYIAPEKIEIAYTKHEVVAQAFVYGDSLQSTLVGIIVPDEETFPKWVAARGIAGSERPLAELCRDEEVKKAVLKSLEEFGKKEGLKGFENVKSVYLDHEQFSVDNGLFTPTFKLKRHEAKKKYQAQIDAMYAKLAA